LGGLIVIVLACASSAASESAMTLERALALAAARNRQLNMAREQAVAQTASLAAIRAQRWPAFSLSQRLTRIDDGTVSRANAASDGLSALLGIEIPPFVYGESYRTKLDLAVPVWTGGALSAAINAEEESLSARYADEAVAQRAVQAEVVRRYFKLAAAIQVRRAREQALDRARRRLQESSHRLEIGLTTRQEVLRWRVQVEAALAEQAAAEAELLIARLELADTLQIPFDRVESLLPPMPEQVTALLEWAQGLDADAVLAAAAADIEALPELLAARSRAEAAAAGTRAARAGLMPRADFAATIGWLENETIALDELREWSASLLVTVPLDLRGDLRAQIRQVAALERVAEVAVDDVAAAVHLAVGRAMAEVLRTRTALTSAERAREEAASRRELLSHQTEVGLASLLDLVDADTTLVAAEVAQATARSSFLAAVAGLELAWPGAEPPDGGLIP
jgi:outer membrane protein TolC